MTRQITIEEVKKHKHKSSVWMIIHNDVYDVTSFLEEHPGGEESLTMFAGKDGTQAFEDVNHSEDARELLKKYKIGTLPPEQHNRHIDRCLKVVENERPWRTFDSGSSGSCRKSNKSESNKYQIDPNTGGRLGTIVVPSENPRPLRQSRPRGFPCNDAEGSSNRYKWAVLALGGALVLGFVLKKYLAR